jgi:hypothetical protein
MPVSSYSLVIAIKVKESFAPPPGCYVTLCKNTTSAKTAYFSMMLPYITSLQWHDIHTEFHENRSAGLRVEMEIHKQAHGGLVSFRLLPFLLRGGRWAKNAK